MSPEALGVAPPLTEITFLPPHFHLSKASMVFNLLFIVKAVVIVYGPENHKTGTKNSFQINSTLDSYL
jgi:hypothetical protein